MIVKSCSSTSNILTLQAESPNQDPSFDGKTLRLTILDQLTNPPSAFCDAFNISVVDELNNQKISVSSNYSIEAGKLNMAKITSASEKSGEVTDLTFSFIPSNSILKGGLIYIILPFFDDNLGFMFLNRINLYPNNVTPVLKSSNVIFN